MTRKDLLLQLIGQAQANGFEFRRWYESRISPEWPGAEGAMTLLCEESRYYTLIFAHDFARAFWKQGAQMKFAIPSATYMRVNGKGEVITVNRKTFTRRTIKADVWKYHLSQMAATEDPLRYLERFVPTSGEILIAEVGNANPVNCRFLQPPDDSSVRKLNGHVLELKS